ncbi:MAG: ATP-binding protein, partial [Acidimicrobiales bacterium]
MSDIAVGSVGDPSDGQPGEATPGGPGSSRRVFVGRQAESAILDRVWSDTSDGPCSLVIVHGNAGFGKSLLINAFVGRIAPPVLLRVACEPDESTLAYAALGQLLSGDPAWRTKVLRDTVGDEGDADPLATGSRLLEMFEALGEDGLVVTIDDVAWADPSSVRALVFALRRLRGGRVLVVFTCRDESLDTLPASLQRMLHDLARWVPLGGFGPVEVAELATALGLKTLSSPAADRVVSHSAGSPLHARALLDDLSTEQLEGDPDWPLPAPIAFSDLVRARLTACGPQGTSLVETAAVSGDGPSARLLAEISGIADVTVALEEAASAGLIRLPLADGQIRLDHPLVRSTIYHDIPPSRLAELHQQIADRWGPSNAVAGLRHRVAA